MGSIFRTADAAGVEKIYLVGYTPAPLDRFGRHRKDFAKVSLGAEYTVPWVHRKTLANAVREIRMRGYTVAAVEQDARSVPLFDYKPPRKLALVFGNEVRGLSQANLKQCDAILEIPMYGRKESLNVSVAAGVALFMLRRRIN